MPNELARLIKSLKPHLPLTDRFERALERRGRWSRQDAWYASQKEHWLGWLSEYDGPGAFDRKAFGGRTAAFAYNHIVCAPMLLWLAEASGVPEDDIEAAHRAALAGTPSLMT